MKGRVPIAIVGMACRYPDARSAAELWENALAQRRAFRRIPQSRLRHEDYYSADRTACDSVYTMQAAVIEGYEFDRHRFNISGPTYRSVDLAHWLALDIAAAAIDDGGFAGGRELPRGSTGVILGNTLTGEFSRANLLRTRWPYVRRMVEGALLGEQWDGPRRRKFLEGLERQYKAPFPPGNEETLAGGLSNTIAGRICNYFDLKGGGYTVDGACASSLLAVANACALLSEGELDVALAGGVDLSLDPFELVGFSRAGALAEHEMRVFDVRSQGFWPGEGCGFVALMRQDDALRQNRRIYATIRGWGISSDGAGGITRPEVQGQHICLGRAYRGLDFSIADVAYFEGHGTGTAVGDTTELKALAAARSEAGADADRAVIGSIKANIGHTKAAAGVAGLIKAAMAVHHQVQPPNTACNQPHAELTNADSTLQILRSQRAWPAESALCAAVSAMGFGGINSHVVLQGDRTVRSVRSPRPASQDCEIFLFAAADVGQLRSKISSLRKIAPDLSRAELGDMAAALAGELADHPYRAAVVASDPATLAGRLDSLLEITAATSTTKIDLVGGVFFGVGRSRPRIGLLCCGQGHAVTLDGGAVARRFDVAGEMYDPPISGDIHSPMVVQPGVVRASLAAIRVLRSLGIEADLAVGHSLGELTALCWAGAFDEKSVLQLASTRARLMVELSTEKGAMASIGADPTKVRELCNGDAVAIACHNGPRQTVISGSAHGVRAVVSTAQSRGVAAVMLKTTHAFHSTLVAPAADAFPAAVRELGVESIRGRIISTVAADDLNDSRQIPELLGRQITSPVLFAEAIAKASDSVDLFIEVGSGDVLSRMVADQTTVAAASVDVGGDSLWPLLTTVGAAFVLGANVSHAALFQNRLIRPISLDWKPKFFANPCEAAPILDDASTPGAQAAPQPADLPAVQSSGESALEIVRRIIAQQEELQPQSIGAQSHLLRDLHLNSLKVAEIVAKACRQMGLPIPASPTEMSGATVGQIATALEQQKRVGPPAEVDSPFPGGIDGWVRAFKIAWVQRPLDGSQPRMNGSSGTWEIFGKPSGPLRANLHAELSAAVPRGGVAMCMEEIAERTCIGEMLASARAALARFSIDSPGVFVLVHRGGGAGFAKTLLHECPGAQVCVVDVPLEHPMALKWIAAEAAVVHGYEESRYDDSGRRWVPVLENLPSSSAEHSLGLNSSDVVLVSGGGKGIAAECALELAIQSGAKLLILGRSEAGQDAELSANLARLVRRGVRFSYQPADVTDAAGVSDAVRRGVEQVGKVTAIIHGAGINEPQLLGSLDEAAFLRTVRPKVDGLNNLLACTENPRLLVTFGSVIAQVGMRGEADYSVANEWMGGVVERFARAHPACRCVNLEWSVWSGVGMGPRLGSITPLMAQGITPITPDAGVKKFLELLRDPQADGSIIVSSRYGELSTIKSPSQFHPGRFVQTARCFYPGVELVAETTLSRSTDPYLADHVFRGRCLLPGVVGLEMMAEAAANLCDSARVGMMEEIRFDHAIEIPADGSIVVRTAALAREDGRIDVVVRSSATRFAVNHFSATCRGDSGSEAAAVMPDAHRASAAARLDPAKDLYGSILFQGKTFQRVRKYEHLRARQCVVQVDRSDADDGLGQREGLILGDPAGRDAAIHAIQACIPHVTVLPVSIERLEFFHHPRGTCRLVSSERSSDSSGFVYDLSIWSEDGELAERWTGLRLQSAGECKMTGPWPAALAASYFERRIGDLLPALRDVEIEWDFDGRDNGQGASDHRPDGKPDAAGAIGNISRAHFAGGRLTCTAGAPLGVDVEAINGKSADRWADVLGAQRMELAKRISESTGEPLARSAGRVWCAVESLGKLSAPLDVPLTLSSVTADGWALLGAGEITVASYVAAVGDAGDSCFAFASVGAKPKAYEMLIRVGFDEVNRMGTVNFQSYFNWQARCREAFLHDHAPAVIRELHQGLLLVTTDASCQYVAEIDSSQPVVCRMSLAELGEHTLAMRFEFVQRIGDKEIVVARGSQSTASMQRTGGGLVASPIPPPLRQALAPFADFQRAGRASAR